MTITPPAAPPSTSSAPPASAQQLFNRVMTPTYAPMDIMPARAQGSRLWDTAGTEYLDFAGGIAVSALGHAHPELIAALTTQAKKFWHVSNILTNQPALQLAQMLCDATFAERVFLANSGAEANEAALKLARRYALEHSSQDKIEILAFDNAFHGRTFFTVCVGGKAQYSDGFGPKPAGISHLPFNDCQAVREFFQQHQHKICAVILEPCQGEGGVTLATPAFIEAIRAGCDQYNALMILDEIQTGVGRSGALFAYQKFGVVPDILTAAKALGCGIPIGAMLTTEKIAASLSVGSHGSTFGGNPLTCAVACKALELINHPALLHGVNAKSAQLIAGLQAINKNHQVFTDIRAMGLLIGCELTAQYGGRAREVLIACSQLGLLTLVAGADVIRLCPPLNISQQDIATGLNKLEQGIIQAFGL